PTDTPIDLFDPIAIQAVWALASKRIARIERKVNRRMREIQEERSLAMLLQESHRLVGISFDELRLPLRIDATEDHFVSKQRQRRVPGIATNRVKRLAEVAPRPFGGRPHVI